MTRCVVQIRCTPEEKAAWQAIADILKMSLSDWMRMRLTGEEPSTIAQAVAYVTTKPVMTPEPPVMTKHHPRCACAMCKPPKP